MQTTARSVGIDVHRQYVVVAAVDDQQQLVLAPSRVDVERFPQWAQRHLAATDQVALRPAMSGKCMTNCGLWWRR